MQDIPYSFSGKDFYPRLWNRVLWSIDLVGIEIQQPKSLSLMNLLKGTYSPRLVVQRSSSFPANFTLITSRSANGIRYQTNTNGLSRHYSLANNTNIPIKVLVSNTTDPFFNLATEEWIFRHAPLSIPTTTSTTNINPSSSGSTLNHILFLWRNAPTVRDPIYDRYVDVGCYNSQWYETII